MGVESEKKKTEEEEGAESGPGKRKMWIAWKNKNDGRLMWQSVPAASYLHSEKLSGAALSGSRHRPRLRYFPLEKKTNKKRQKGEKEKENILGSR